MSSARTLAGAVRRAVTDEVLALDGATVALAETYARRIDTDPDQLAKLGPLLLAALDALRMTPRSRATAAKGTPGATAPVSNPLDELRQRRGARTNRSTPVDPPAAGTHP